MMSVVEVGILERTYRGWREKKVTGPKDKLTITDNEIKNAKRETSIFILIPITKSVRWWTQKHC
jgi:hypothetical protein